MLLVYLALGWVAGILLAERTEPPPIWPLVGGVLFGFGLWIYRQDKNGRLVFGVLIFAALGMLRFESARPDLDEGHVMQLNDQGSLVLRGVVISEPIERDNGLRFLVRAEEAAGRSVHGQVLATVPRDSSVEYGDRVGISGWLRTPAEFDTFSYSNYLARQNVFSVINGGSVQILSEGNGFRFYAALLRLKDHARDFIQRSLPEPQASLAVGMLLGDESGLSEDIREDFSRTGASHLIAISGFNMVIVAQTVMLLLKQFTTPQKAAIGGLGIILLYTILVGAGGSVVRAAIMSALLIIGEALGRKTYVPASLAFTALLMTILDPWVLWDVGFQLSFLAVLGMALLVRPMERWMNRGLEQVASQSLASRLGRGFSQGVIVTLAAQIATTPLIVYYFGRLSIVSLLVNLLVIPVQPPLLLFGALGTLVGLVIPPLGDALLMVAWIFLSWNVAVVEFFADLPWADQEFSLSSIGVWGFVILLFGAAIYQGTRPRWLTFTRRRLWVRLGTAAAVATLILMVSILLDRPDGKLHVTYLDGGVLIQSSNGAAILVDGGEFPSRLLDDLGDALPTRSRKIEAVIVTAPEERRIAALPEVLERYQVGVLLTNGQSVGELNPLLERAAEEDVPVVPVSAGYELTTDDGLRIEVLHPLTIPTRETPLYDGSLVLRVTYGEAVFLLTGGIQAESEARLLSQSHQVQATVLQVASGGSGNASSAIFILTANPQVAVLQIGTEDNPSTAVLDRLNNTRLFRTDQDGQIEIVTDGTELWIYAENQ